MKSLIVVAVVFGVVALAPGCGGSSPGESCSQDSDCADGVACLYERISNNSICENFPGQGVCSLACKTNADCATYGSNFKCALSSTSVPCNPTGTCRENYSCSGNCRQAPEK